MKTAKHDVVIITGAASGIGEAISRSLYHHGMAVVLADKDIVKLSHVAKSLDDHEGRVLIVPVDISDEKSMESLRAEAIAKFGHIDFVLNGEESIQHNLFSKERNLSFDRDLLHQTD